MFIKTILLVLISRLMNTSSIEVETPRSTPVCETIQHGSYVIQKPFVHHGINFGATPHLYKQNDRSLGNLTSCRLFLVDALKKLFRIKKMKNL